MATERTRRAVLAASGSLATLGLAGCFGDDGDDEEYVAVEALTLTDPETGESLTAIEGDGWEVEPLLVPLEGRLPVGARVEDADGELPLGEDESYHVGAVAVEEGDETVAIEPDGDRVGLVGRSAGKTEITVELWDGDRFGWDSPPLEVEVVDDFEGPVA
ncbi:aspartic acid-rich protein [Natronococcus amylolyticus DSM 10524]|uniref:Aspartic acid-rich protein n=1 Tax=Natronococcus amylolyticus DSM 10524 TaxID=1227497 RepID=L9X958_9EURY|nr:hypothetical protein [Natronococcus amylolyticus]ELY57966.1 aspartic acid-rich protein [Natronococcus amylolyticus DSM 10524]